MKSLTSYSFTLALIAAATVTTTATAQVDSQPQDVEQDAGWPTSRVRNIDTWTAFQEKHGAGWNARWNKATGTPSRVYGPGLRVSDGAIESAAQATEVGRQVLRANAALLGLGQSTFVETSSVKVGKTYILTYQQKLGQLDVVGGRADVRLNENGVVSMFGSSAVIIPDGLRLAPSVRAETAFETACDHAGVAARAANHDAPKTLILYADTTKGSLQPAKLAWQVTVDGRSATDITLGRACVDAQTGQVLAWTSDVYECWEGHRHISPRAYGAPSEPFRSEDFLADSRLARSLELRKHLAAGDTASVSLPSAADRIAAERPMDLVGTVMGWVNTSSNGLAATVNVPMPDILVTGPNGTSTFTDENGTFVIPFTGTGSQIVNVGLSGRHIQDIVPSQGTRVTAGAFLTPGVASTLQLSTPNASEFAQSQMDTYWWTTEVNNYMRGLLGNVGQLNVASNIVATVNVDNIQSGPQVIPGCNAFYSGNSMTFMSLEPQPGPDCSNTAIGTVITHEWGHGLDDRFGGITQQDGLSEGWGDLTASYHSGQPVVGQGFTTNGGIVRTAANNSQVPAGGFPPANTQAPHPQGQIWAGFAWSVRNGLIASLGQAAGIARAEQIVLSSVVADARNQEDAVFEVFVLDDDDGDLSNGTPNYDVLSAAAEARGYNFPEINFGAVGHVPLEMTDEQLTPRIVRATVVPGIGSIDNVELVFSVDGAPEVRRPMVPLGPFFRQALLPGARAGQSVSYRIEATHSTGIILSQPEAGNFSYDVIFDLDAGTILFADDFESGAPGWTSQQLATQDDWQLGVSAGRNSNGFGGDFGITWSDPTSAFSGTSIYANDLGNGNFNGAYANNVSNFLQSPPIDLTNATSPVLRFQRWLSVEEGQFDQATITVNGTTIFANPVADNLIDTDWTTQEFSLAAFAGQTVSIRWNLVTDGALQLGGWALDDVTVFDIDTSGGNVGVELEFTPSQVEADTSTALSIQGAPLAPIALLVATDPTPISIPGLIDLEVSPPFAAIPLNLDAQGDFNALLPIGPATASTFVYLQAIQLDAGVASTSNLGIVFIVP